MSGDVQRSLSFCICKSSNSTACLSVKECATNYSNASACAQRSPNQTWGRIWTESSSGEKQEWEAGERLLSYGRAANNHLSGCHRSCADFSNVVAAVGHWQGRGGGHTVAPTVGLAVLAPPVSCAQISADNHCCHQVGPKVVLSHNLAIGHGSDVLMIAQGLKPSWLITGIII